MGGPVPTKTWLHSTNKFRSLTWKPPLGKLTSAALQNFRSEWDSSDEPCQKKMSFELWTLMKAEGSAQNSDAQYVRANCLQTKELGLIELITPKVCPCAQISCPVV